MWYQARKDWDHQCYRLGGYPGTAGLCMAPAHRRSLSNRPSPLSHHHGSRCDPSVMNVCYRKGNGHFEAPSSPHIKTSVKTGGWRWIKADAGVETSLSSAVWERIKRRLLSDWRHYFQPGARSSIRIAGAANWLSSCSPNRVCHSNSLRRGVTFRLAPIEAVSAASRFEAPRSRFPAPLLQHPIMALPMTTACPLDWDRPSRPRPDRAVSSICLSVYDVFAASDLLVDVWLPWSGPLCTKVSVYAGLMTPAPRNLLLSFSSSIVYVS
jgi:hypothetical protein